MYKDSILGILEPVCIRVVRGTSERRNKHREAQGGNRGGYGLTFHVYPLSVGA